MFLRISALIILFQVIYSISYFTEDGAPLLYSFWMIINNFWRPWPEIIAVIRAWKEYPNVYYSESAVPIPIRLDSDTIRNLNSSHSIRCIEKFPKAIHSLNSTTKTTTTTTFTILTVIDQWTSSNSNIIIKVTTSQSSGCELWWSQRLINRVTYCATELKSLVRCFSYLLQSPFLFNRPPIDHKSMIGEDLFGKSSLESSSEEWSWDSVNPSPIYHLIIVSSRTHFHILFIRVSSHPVDFIVSSSSPQQQFK